MSTYGLALSGGVRGIAHIGVLKALEEKSIQPEFKSGISAGSIVSVLWADGYSAEEILQIASEQRFIQLLAFGFARNGFFNLEGVKKLLQKTLRHQKLEDLSTEIYIGCTNLESGQLEYFSTGSIVDAVLASCSVPFVFQNYSIQGVPYVDGGIVRNLPSEILRPKCNVLIGSDVIPASEVKSIQGIKETSYRILSIIASSNSKHSREICDILIHPTELSIFSFTSFEKHQELFDIAYREAIKQINDYETKL